MFSLLTLDVARDSVARQFQYDEPAAETTTSTPTRTATDRPRRRSNPVGALVRLTHGHLVHATWSPTRSPRREPSLAATPTTLAAWPE